MRAMAVRHPSEWEGMGVESTRKHTTLRGRSVVVEETATVRGTNEMNMKRLKKVKGIVGRMGAISRMARMNTALNKGMAGMKGNSLGKGKGDKMAGLFGATKGKGNKMMGLFGGASAAGAAENNKKEEKEEK